MMFDLILKVNEELVKETIIQNLDQDQEDQELEEQKSTRRRGRTTRRITRGIDYRSCLK